MDKKLQEERLSRTEISEPIIERLCRYARVETTSNPENEGQQPSSQCQFDLAHLLEDELHSLGVEDVTVTEYCYTVARIPASPGYENSPSVLFMCHVDTASDAPGKNVNPIVHKNYQGGPIKLQNNVVIDPEMFPVLNTVIGDTLITADGNTLLGGDDKAGISIVMTALEYILHHDIPHGPLEFVFEPDEEIGNGTNHMPFDMISSKVGYTVDGTTYGELEYECFEAWTANVKLTGVSVHTGFAYGKMVNANLMAASFISKLPKDALPETTKDKQGFFGLISTSSSIESANLMIILRDFTEQGIEDKKVTLQQIAEQVKAEYPKGSVEITFTQSYKNMKTKIMERPEVVTKLEEACRNANVQYFSSPIRGGTDGAFISFKGIPMPNIFTGIFGFHGRMETAIVSHLVAATDTVMELIKIWRDTSN